MAHKHQSLLKAFEHLVSTRPKEKVLLAPNGAEYKEFNFRDLDLIINKYANYWSKQLKNETLKKNNVIGYLSQSGPEYLYNFMALWKLGFTVLFLSPKNSEPALIHLLQEAKSSILIYDSQFSKISNNVQNELGSQHLQMLKIFQLPNNLKNENIDYSAPVLKLDDNSYEKTIAIFHNKADDIILATPPLFHIFGMTVILTTILNPGSVYVFPIVSGSVPLVNEILHSLNQSKANVFYTLPATIEQVYKNRPEEIKTLLKLRSINYAGAALSPQIGERLVQSGVNIHSVYGSTETGVIMDSRIVNKSFLPNIPWNAMKLAIPESYVKWIEKNDFIDGNTEDGDYKVGDLFLETPKETIHLNQFVRQVVVVGFNRPFNCLLIKLDYENIKMTPFLDATKINANIVSNNKSSSNNQWNEDSIKSIILDSLKLAIGDPFSLTDDGETSLFAIGLDSLSATKLRVILQNQFPVINLPYDVIFEYNIFQSLTHYLTKELSKNISSPQSQNIDDYETKLHALKSEVNSYIQKYTVLMTGVTGSLGSFILRNLLNNPNVLKVYCLVRASDKNHGWSRLKDSFEQRHLDTSLLSKERIIILPSDLDFNSKIEAFERESIAGTVHLLRLAREAYTHHQNVHFNFTSSVSTTIGSKTNVKEDELTHDITNAMLNGYGLSEFITENVFTGVWNTREHIPLMIKGAQIMKIMPDSYSSNVDWIPLDIASQNGDYIRVNHIVNPKQVTWNEFLKSLQQSGIDFRIVSNKEWLNTLLNTPEYQNVDKNPVAALSGFFEKVMSESLDNSERHEPLFETHKSSNHS
ncbi:14923_t:CDS:10 [Dentiscutata erythropus]|uniref:14923_t:CDS:1 n=1 Tax=Dentiscutata erythropus TaxID=1348616 RepID=A0A9N8WLB4_9GLOM|nr:14923_t:CDS:10 [Dentiscutata erythropus]